MAVRTSETAVGDASRGTTVSQDSGQRRRRTVRCGGQSMALTPWRGRQRRSRRPEIRGIDRVALHLEVQGLVVHPEEPGRLTLVATRGVKSQAYRLSFRLGGGAAGELLQ